MSLRVASVKEGIQATKCDIDRWQLQELLEFSVGGRDAADCGESTFEENSKLGVDEEHVRPRTRLLD